MTVRFILSDDLDQALAQAIDDALDDGTFAGRVPKSPAAVASATTLGACEAELRSVLEDGILVGLKPRHSLPVVGGLDLNRQPLPRAVDAV
jgi:hypothetical protein